MPPRSGVGQILGPDAASLVIARAAHLRRWAASNLGLGKPPAKGVRPRVDLRPVATAVAYEETGSAFHQRLVFERLMAAHVPRSARRDLRTPAWLHLDPAERFPRVRVTTAPGPSAFGPFRDRKAAARARDALHRLFPLRPCDYTFEPAPDLALGISCLYAQVRTCAAPCLVRIDEGAYRSLAAAAAEFLSRPWSRPIETHAWAPSWVATAASRGLVVESGRSGAELYPVVRGSVLEEDRVTAPPDGVEARLAALGWREDRPSRDDWPWLLAWLTGPRRSGGYLAIEEGQPADALAERIGEVLRATAPREGRRRRALAPPPGTPADPAPHRPPSDGA